MLDDAPLSPFDAIVAQLAACGRGRRIPLHQGKTAFTAPVDLRHWAADEFDYPPFHDGPSAGAASLIAAIRQTLESQLDEDIDPSRIQVTSGITHALSVVFHSVLQPGDEVLLLSPQWLFARGLVQAAHGRPVEVPFFPVSGDASIGNLAETVTPYLTARSRAIYFNTPNNPTGRRIPRRQMDELAEFARDHGLWLIADNAYEHYDFSAEGFCDAAGLPTGRDRTFAAYSFSKSFGLTGYRIGYLLSPPAMAETARKSSLYSIYSVPTVSQFAALCALRGGDRRLQAHRSFVRTARDLTMGTLAVPAVPSEGGLYAFLDLSDWEGGADAFIRCCIAEGVSLAPGWAFGDGYGTHTRLCHSVVGHADLLEGIEVINSVYDRGS